MTEDLFHFSFTKITMMKLIYMLFGALFLCNPIFSQTITVRDITTLQPLAFVSVISTNPDIVVTTNDRGEADITAMSSSASVTFYLTGYQELITTYENLIQQEGKVLLTSSSFAFDEIVVSATRSDEHSQNLAQPVQVIRSQDIAFQNQATSADLLLQTGNVFVQKSQLGGGSPVIRGFEANKVLLVVDGVRMNNAIYRAGHLQNVITLDNASMDKAEILFGPGSVMYGSDALGGVMSFYTKNPTFATGEGLETHVNAFARYGTAADEITGHADVSLGGKKLASLTSFTYSDFSDLLQGSKRRDAYPDFGKRTFYVERQNGVDVAVTNENPDLQVGSGYSQYDLLQKLTFAQNDHITHTLNIQYSTSSDINRYDRLTETSNGQPRFAEWYYGPQKRLFGTYTLALTQPTGLYDQARFVAGYQNIEESRHDRRFNNPSINHRTEQLDIFTLNADFNKAKGKSEWRYGLEGTTNHVNSTAFKENIETGATAPQNTRYPDGGSDMSSLAMYLSDIYKYSDRIVFNAGLRLSYVHLNSIFEDTTFFPFPFNEVTQNNTALSGTVGMVWKGHHGWRWNTSLATGFRAPNVDDLSKVFESVPGTVIVPNPDLGPEQTYTVDLGISKHMDSRYHMGVGGFYTWYRNAITTQPGTFNGESQIIYDGELSDVLTNVNANSAYLYGLNAFLSWDITQALSVSSTINYTYGRINTDTTDYPLDHIPPVFGKTSVNLKVKKFRGEAYAMYHGWKNLEDYNLLGEDNYPFATADGMPSWFTINVRGSYQLTDALAVQLGIENILDANYRLFASNISAPGTNVVLTLRGTW